MLVETVSEQWKKVRRVNATDASFPARVMTTTVPSAGLDSAGTATSQDVLVLRGQGSVTQNIAQFLFYATGSNNQTFSARVYGWSLVQPYDASDPKKNVYVPVLIAEVALTISSTLPGVAGTQVVATELMADTITLTTGNAAKAVVTSPAGDVSAACLDLDFTGFPVIEVVFSVSSGGVTDMNALVRMY